MALPESSGKVAGEGFCVENMYFSLIFNGFGYNFGGDLERIFDQMCVFFHLKNDSDFGAHSRAPRGAPGSPRGEPGESQGAPQGALELSLGSSPGIPGEPQGHAEVGTFKGSAKVQRRCQRRSKVPKVSKVSKDSESRACGQL